MANYTDEQIKKALECCRGKGCKECPFRCGNAVCISNLMKAILDLIERQEAEKSELQLKIANCNAKIEALKEENEQLQTDNFNANMNLEHVQAEIERLKEYEEIRPTGCPNCSRGNFSNSKFCSHCGTQLQGKKKDVRAEAIKEFAERLNEKAYYCEKKDGKDNFVVDEMVIDNLVREMVGESNVD